jgi:ribonuclease Y
MTPPALWLVIGLIIELAVIAAAVFVLRHYYGRAHTRATEAAHLVEQARQEAETIRKSALLEAKDEAHRLRQEIEKENRDRKTELQRMERRLIQKEENLDRRNDAFERKEHAIAAQEKEMEDAKAELTRLQGERRRELERLSALSAEEAKQMLLRDVENEARHEAAKLLAEIEEETRRESHRRAQEIVSTAIQRCAVDQVAESTVSVVPLPSDEMKGRIIGREGRNIRAFETLTGVDLIVDDTPEAVVISAFDPVRREIARIALASLVNDGRIHPGRIEDMIEKAKTQVEERMQQAAERATFETGVTGLHSDLLRLLGRLRFRTTLGQNALDHSVEVSHLAGMMAAELEANEAVARRAGLLHDIGKAVDFEMTGTHTAIGVDLAKHCHESPEVIHAIAAHHEDEEFHSVEAVLVYAADAISAARPGARRETLETYIKRLEKLEEIADSAPGVEKAYAIQAGREIRIIVKPEAVDDLSAARLAKDMATRIEQSGLDYPGQIKVTVIRETRVVEYAR